MQNTLLNNRYLIEAELGRGGMGIVYRARDTLLEREVAVKVLMSSTLGSQGRARLLREAQAAARLNHPNIINIYDAGDAEGMSYIVMEMLDGDSLFDKRPTSLDEILRIIRQICDALEHAHSHGIIHRDLKPENVIVTSKGVAKLTDFGLSRSLSGRISQEGVIVGTVYYLAPEQALRQDIDSRADLYALGIMIYELVTGRLPFTADDPLGVISQHLNASVVPPSTYNNSIPPALEALILRLMSKRPEDRPATAGQVREALDRLYEEPQEYAAEILAGLSPLDRLARGRLVGRQEEVNHVKAFWRAIVAQDPPGVVGGGTPVRENVLIISGEAGVGKTPLIKEIRSLAQVSGGHAWLAHCYSEEAAPYSPIIQLLREAQPLPEGLPDLVMADLQALAPDLGERPVPVKPSLSPLSEQQRLFESLFALFATVAEREPLLLIMEDAQWADANSLLLLRHLARRSRSTHLRLMMVVSYRPGELKTGSPLESLLMDLNLEGLSESINLLPYTREQTREVLSTMFLGDITEPFVDAIYKVTEGNLFFIEQICKALIEEGKLYCDGGAWHFSGIEQLELPPSVRVALQLRFNRLPEGAQDLLRLAAVIGREFDYEVLRRSCDQQNEDQLIDSLEMAERAQLITEVQMPRRAEAANIPGTSLFAASTGSGAVTSGAGNSERFAFAHTLIPAMLVEEISSIRRHRMHRRIASAIEIVHPDDLEGLAYHFTEAGDADKARHYTFLAGERARKLYANTQALRFYNEALRLTPAGHPDRFRIIAARAQVYDMLARREEQRADIETMVQLADETNDDSMRCDALIALADLFAVTENFLTREPADKAVEIARRLGDPVREGRALRTIGWDAYVRHNYHESVSALETAVARFRQADMLAQAAECLHMLSLVTGMQGLGELNISEKFARDSIHLSRMASDPRHEAIGLRRLAIVQMDQGKFNEALEIGEEALNLHRELGDRSEECMALNTVAVMLSWQGRYEEAYRFFQQSFDMSLAINSNMGFWIGFANMEWFYYRREGLYEAGLAFADVQLARVEVSKDPFLYANLLHVKAELLRQVGQYPAALDALRQACTLADEHAGPIVRAGIRLDTASIQAVMHHFREAENTLEEVRVLANRFERPNDMAAVYITEAEIAREEWEAGDLKQLRRAAAQIEHAVALLRGTHWKPDLACALQTATWIALARNRPEQALKYSTEALDIYEEQPVRPEGYQYVHVNALWANGQDEEANDLLEKAYLRVMQVANLLKDDTLRKSWLEDVTVNRQIVNDWVSYHGL